MIRIENVEVVGWEPTIRGMRNPKNSWDRMDSALCRRDMDDCKVMPACDCPKDGTFEEDYYCIGENDHDLMMRLAKGGPVHAKYRRMIVVYLDITAPLYWWKEFDTYKVGTVANSCSTMHKIQDKEFTMNDFSHEHLGDEWDSEEQDDCEHSNSIVYYNYEYGNTPRDILEFIVEALNHYRRMFLETKNKYYWWQMIQLLPTSYNQKRTVMLNYEVLVGMYESRRGHKLDEWRDFCEWIETLPYSEIITGKKENE